jgi:hypothetical protein
MCVDLSVQVFVNTAFRSNSAEYRPVFEYGGGYKSFAACDHEP